MGLDFRFNSLQDEAELCELENFLRSQPLRYPDYQDWVTKAKEELLSGYKTSILAFNGRTLIGNLIFQPHKTFPRVREVKNLRVHSQLRGRYFGSFMLRQGEFLDRDSYDAIILDVRSNQLETINVLKSLGYEEIVRAPLYEKNVDEVIMAKKFEETPEGFFLPIRRVFS